jgi:hypothetical protein
MVDSFGGYVLAIAGMPATFPPSQVSLMTYWNAIGTGNPQVGVLANSGSHGNPALSLPFGGQIARTVTHQSQYTVGMTLSIQSLAGVGGATPLIDLVQTGTILASLRVDTDGSIFVYGNNTPGGAPIFTTPIEISAGVLCYLEFQAAIAAEGSDIRLTATVRVNGVQVGTGNGLIGRNVDSVPAGATFNQIYLNSGVQTNGGALISDFYMNNGQGPTNTGFLAGTTSPWLRIDALVADADSSPLQWTPLSGMVHFTEINELPATGDASYNASTAAATIDAYKWQPIPSFIGTVQTIQLKWSGRSTDEGTVLFVGGIGPLGVEAQTAKYGLCDSYFYRSQCFDLNPATGLPWLQSEYNAKDFTIEQVAP